MWDFTRFSDNVMALDEAGNRLRYGEMDRENQRMAAALGGRRLVFLLCTNTIGSLAGYTGCLQSRAVPLLLSAGLDRELLRHLLEVYRPDYLWVPEEREAEFPEGRRVYGVFGYALLRNSGAAGTPLHEDLCLLLTTSGSTGSPKLVRQSYANVLENAKSIVQYLELDETERPITTLPMNYTYGLSIVNSHLLVGATLLLTEKGLMQKEFWRFFKEAGATSFGGVPYTYEMLDRLRFTRMELPSLRTMTQAGGKLPPELHRKFAEYARSTGRRFFVMYGQAEATARMGYLPPAMSLEKCGSMGIAIPGGALSLVDPEGRPVTEPHTTGELIYRGPNVTLGYAERGEDLARGDDRHGVLETGDMAQFDEDGYFYIVGRKKRFLKIFGNRVNLDDVDRMVRAEFPGTDCAGTGRDDRLYLFLTGEVGADRVRRFLSEKTGLNPAAFTVLPVAEIPRNDAGKILYAKLERQVEEMERGHGRAL